MSSNQTTPIITVDGPSGAGKGTLCQLIAQELSWHLLDSGALYRLVALAANNRNISESDSQGLAKLAQGLDVQFKAEKNRVEIVLESELVTEAIRTEKIGMSASKIAAIPEVRAALLQRQRDFAQAPGLVADGRDMGTVVFPNAALKIFLDASAEERASRRYKQLINKGVGASLQEILTDVKSRDAQDRGRAVAPLAAAKDAVVIDSTNMTIEQVLTLVIDHAHHKGLR